MILGLELLADDVRRQAEETLREIRRAISSLSPMTHARKPKREKPCSSDS